jgi:hypothetical protein
MISRRLAEPEQLGSANIIDGRILHTRIHFDNRALDIVATYQYVAARTPASNQQRATVWSALNDLLHTLPSRNNLICMGDYNCGLTAQPPWVGTTAFQWQGKAVTGPSYPDQERLQEILLAHGLTAINTWGPSGPSYVHGNTASRIDHFFIRMIACDGQSKQVLYLPTADFVPHNNTHHVPMMCNIRTKHMAYHKYDHPTASRLPNAIDAV